MSAVAKLARVPRPTVGVEMETAPELEVSPTVRFAADSMPEFFTSTTTCRDSPASKKPSPSPISVRVVAVVYAAAPAIQAVRRKASSFSRARGMMRDWGGQKPSPELPISGVQEYVPWAPWSWSTVTPLAR